MHFYSMVHRDRASKACWLAVGATALVLGALCGCGGSSAAGKVLYALGPGNADVAIFGVSGSGALTPVASVPTGSSTDAIAIDPGHRFAYIVDSAGGIGPGGVWQYVLGGNSGVLVPATFSSATGAGATAPPAETGTNPVAIAIDSSSTFVFVANQGSDSISVFTIDVIGCAGICGNGTLTEVKQPPPAPIPPNCVTNNAFPCPLSLAPASPTGLATSGNMLFVAMSNAGVGSVSTYTFDSTGLLKTPAVSSTPVGLNPSTMTMDASGKFLFLTDSSAGQVAVVSISSSGQLGVVDQSAPCAATTCATGPMPLNAWVHPSGKFLYTANKGGAGCVNGAVSAFSVDSLGGLVPLTGSPFAAGPCPSYVATDSSGSLLFVANGGNNNTISVFTIDSSGAPKEPGTSSPSIVINPVALASIN